MQNWQRYLNRYRMMRYIFLMAISLLFCAAQLSAQTTRVVVRAKAKDAKFLPATLGVHVAIKNNMTGEVLAKGWAVGGSGNTDVIMAESIRRGQQLADENTSKFEASLELSEPTFVDIEVYASANRKNGTRKVTTQIWLIPGKHILGDGIVLEIPGFIVDVLSPTTQQYIRLTDIKQGKLTLKASITMACGCVISKGGTWDAERFTIKAVIRCNGKDKGELPLQITNLWNNFEADIPMSEKGDYLVYVYAYDQKTGNTGLDKVNFTIL